MTMTIDMPDAMAKRVCEKCAREGRSIGEVAVAVFGAWLGEGSHAPRSVRRLKGMLGYRGPAVSLEEMDRAIASGGGE